MTTRGPEFAPHSTKAEFFENITEVKSPEYIFLAITLLKTTCPERIILLALIRVGQNGISLAELFEFLFSFLVPFIAIRVIFHGQLAIGLFYILG